MPLQHGLCRNPNRHRQTRPKLNTFSRPARQQTHSSRPPPLSYFRRSEPELRDHIEQLQQATTRTGAPRRETANHASEESLRRRLALAHQHITQLRTENQQLRESLARAHGQLRATRDTAGSAIATGKEPDDDRA